MFLVVFVPDLMNVLLWKDVLNLKKPTGSRFLIVQQLKKVLREAIPRIQSLDEANSLESEIFRARSNKILTDKEYQEYTAAIKEVCILQGWITGDQSAAAPMQHNSV